MSEPMDFRIAYTFTDSLARLTGDEQKAAKMTAFDLQLNPASPGMQFHKLDKAKDTRFWSVRIGRDLRMIVHKSEGSLLLCYVDHHDKAYDWASRRKLETHPKTGAAQLIEIRETVREIVVPTYVQGEAATPVKPRLFAKLSDDELLSYGVPAEWIADVRQANEHSLLSLTDHLPSEAAESLLELATGGKPRTRELVGVGTASVEVDPASGMGLHTAAGGDETRPAAKLIEPGAPSTNPFDHPDAQRRFRVMTNVEELERALEYPWEKWTVFLHPEQRQCVEREYNGPARISGSAGTGKTIVAIHRAAHLARTRPDARILLATFSDTLASALRTKLKRLIGDEPRLGERIDVHSLNSLGLRLYKSLVGPVDIVDHATLRAMFTDASKAVGGHNFTLHFLLNEWEHVVDAWQVSTWEAYRDVARLGRKTRLPEAQRAVLWSIFERVRAGLLQRKLVTTDAVFTEIAAALSKAKHPVFDFAIVDEAQDVSVAQLRFFAALGANRPDALFFAGDLGQRIFQQPFSWKSLGVDVRGRSRNLRVNYRTSHQIRMQADRLLGPAVTDVDGSIDVRNDTVSVFNGPPPVIRTFDTEDEEAQAVGDWLTEQTKANLLPHELAVFVRSAAQLGRAQAAVTKSGLSYKVLDENVETASGKVSISTMHLAKGLEFRAVAVMACDDEVLPLQERIEAVGDDADLREVYDTERHLLYVACTRARDQILITSVKPASEFLDDLR